MPVDAKHVLLHISRLSIAARFQKSETLQWIMHIMQLLPALNALVMPATLAIGRCFLQEAEKVEILE